MILILDFGSQYTQLIARRIRECGVYSEILPYDTAVTDILKKSPDGIVLSGGPASVTSRFSPECDSRIFDLGIPVLGICYGMQLIAKKFGARVISEKGKTLLDTIRGEYGRTRIFIDQKATIFRGLARSFSVWMSHSDIVVDLPAGFKNIASTENIKLAGFVNPGKKLYGLQFHPEVKHTQFGNRIIRNFVFAVCRAKKDWNLKSFVARTLKEIKQRVGNSRVICGISGGVDSSTTAVLLHKAIGRNLHCIFVDNGLLRKDEPERIKAIFGKKFKLNIKFVAARANFLSKLKGVVDPERKRKIVGHEFIRIFENEAKKLKSAKFLAQGTLYPDLIESKSVVGPSATIKTHHNVGGLPEKMKLELIEPLKFLFKDEVRKIAQELRLPDEIVWRQPFPGPGLAIRVIGEVTAEKLEILKSADWILIDEIKKSGLYSKLWQSFAVLLPVKTVGVMGDRRTYEYVIAIRAVESLDGMTADFSQLPYSLLQKISSRIVNEVKNVNRVVYDISSKPPATIEWE